MTATTPLNITAAQVGGLRSEAAEAGDNAQVVLCDDALRGALRKMLRAALRERP